MRHGLCAVLLLASMPASAQHRSTTVCELPIGAPVEAGEARLGARAVRETCDAPTATFDVSFDGFSADAERAFAAAVETWSCRVVSDVPIRIDASWEPLGAAVLGSAGPFLTRNFAGAPALDTWYPAALANALSDRDLSGGADIEASFNSSFATWHLDPDTLPGANDYDLYTVVLHELGHGLGFIGNLAVEDGLGYVGLPGDTEGAFIYDRFTRSGAGESLVDLGDGSLALADALQTEVVFVGSVAQAATGGALPLHAPSNWEPGGSYSHLDEQAYPRDTPDGLMTPFVARGETIDAPGVAVCAVLADIGWTLGGECALTVGPVEPAGAALAIRAAGPNPVRGADIEVVVSAAVPQTARLTLVDALGRRVARDEVSVGPDPLPVRFSARALASGVYIVVVEAGGEQQSLTWTVVQ